MSTKFTNDMWRMPRNANQSKSSNYSWNYGTNAKFNISSPANAGITSSISFWFKRAVVTNVSQPYEIAGIYGMWMSNTTMYIRYGPSGYQTVDSATGLTQDGLDALTSTDWVHWVLIREATATSTQQNFKMYANTNEVFSSSSPSNFGSENTEVDMIWATAQSQSTSIDSFSIFNYALSPSQITTLYGSSSIGIGNPMSLSPKPVAYYSLGDQDAFNGANYLVPNNSLKDYVFDFDNTGGSPNDVITAPNILPASSDFTISFWVNPDSSQATYATTTLFGNSANGENIQIISRFGNGYFYVGNGASAYISQSNAVQANVWTLITVTYDNTASVLTAYLNGGENTYTSSSGITLPSQSFGNILQIGRGATNVNTTYFNGEISNFQVFNTLLSSTEVTTLYNYGSPIQTLANIPQNSNLKAWYKLDASEVYNSSTTEWTINDALSSYPQSFNFASSSGSRINCGPSGSVGSGPINSINGAITIGIWVNTTSTSGNEYPIMRDFTGSDWRFRRRSDTGRIHLAFLNTSNATLNVELTGSNDPQGNPYIVITDGKWHHIVGVYNGTDTAELYIDGVLQGTTTSANFGTLNTTARTVIGGYNNSNGNPLGGGGSWNGNLSNAQIWNTNLISSEITTLYNNGSPYAGVQPKSSNLKGWWKLDASSTYDGTNWSFPDASGNSNTAASVSMTGQNIVNNNVSTLNGESSGMTQANLVQSDLSFTSSYSSYALDFDGTNDYINCGNNSSLEITGNFTISTWVNLDTMTSYRRILGKANSNNSRANYGLGLFNGYRPGVIANATGTWFTNYSSTALSTGVWHHLVGLYDGSNFILYVNGSLDNSTPVSGFNIATAASGTSGDNLLIGALPANTENFNGSMSNASIWNAALTSAQVTELYNKGVPSNLNNHSAYSNLVSWWQLGSNTYWADPYWIALDEKGTNNGQSQNIAAPNNMGEDAIVDGVGSYANAVSVGLGALNHFAGEAPYSTANAKSTNMGVTARGTDVP